MGGMGLNTVKLRRIYAWNSQIINKNAMFSFASLLNEKQMVPNSLIITAVLPRAMQLRAIRNDFCLLTQSLSQSLDKLSVRFERNLTIERRAEVRPSLEQELEGGSGVFVSRSACTVDGGAVSAQFSPHWHAAAATYIGESQTPLQPEPAAN